MPKTSRKKLKKKGREWIIGDDLYVEAKHIFNQDAIFIHRPGGGLVVIDVNEAERLAELLPVVVAEVRKNGPNPAAPDQL